MTTYVSSGEAARLLGVTKPTLYAYVSRGLVERRTAADGRSSLYARDELERLAQRSRRREPGRAAIDVEIASSITELDDERLTYRGVDVVDLARTATFEQTAELLWTGKLPNAADPWKPDRQLLQRCRQLIAVAQPSGAIATLGLAAAALAGSGPGDGPATGRTLIALAPSLLGGPSTGSIASRLAGALQRRPPPELVAAVECGLVLLADHELATSTLAVRVACSVRADPWAALATGLHVLGGPLHGTASSMVADVLDEALSDGGQTVVQRTLAERRRLPGFGHSVYRRGDPRFAPLLDAVRSLPDADQRMIVVDDVLIEAGRRVGVAPNVDFALGAMMFVADLPRDAPLFAVARIAGWMAHYDEELGERPVRYRGVTTRR